jgi:anhydro-N-acetylmuramic acid kinase
MISGTSFDAIDVAAADLFLEGDLLRCRLLGSASCPHPAGLRDRLAAALPPAATTLEEVCRLDTLLGQAFADAAAWADAELCQGSAELCCSHGQTVFHWVEEGRALGTLQLGEPAWIAERTGLTVVADTRARDIAVGGQGAPLVSLLDSLLLAVGPGTVRAALNLGGIANVTVVGDGREPLAFDTGPANALIDAAVRRLTDGAESLDRDGARARRGRIDPLLLKRLLSDPYYRQAPPKSTGKELYHPGYVDRMAAGLEVGGDDLVATLTQLTVETIAADLERFSVAEVFASGGGTRNPVLMERLGRRLAPIRLRRSDDLGVPEAAKEALAFALIGFYTVSGLAATVPSCTGGSRPVILGSVTPGRGGLRLPPPAPSMPRRLVWETA